MLGGPDMAADAMTGVLGSGAPARSIVCGASFGGAASALAICIGSPAAPVAATLTGPNPALGSMPNVGSAIWSEIVVSGTGMPMPVMGGDVAVFSCAGSGVGADCDTVVVSAGRGGAGT